MNFCYGEHKRKGHILCNRNKHWSGYSSGDILVLEFDLFQKLWKIEGMI